MDVKMMHGEALFDMEELTVQRFQRYTRGRCPFVLLGNYTVAIPDKKAIDEGLLSVVNFAEDAMYDFLGKKYRYNVSIMGDDCLMFLTTCGIYAAASLRELGLRPGQQPTARAVEQMIANIVDDLDDDDIIAVVNHSSLKII